MTNYCEYCGVAFEERWQGQRCCGLVCEVRQVEFEEHCDEIEEEAEIVERLGREMLDGDISGFFEEDSDDTALIRELVGDGLYDLGGEGGAA